MAELYSFCVPRQLAKWQSGKAKPKGKGPSRSQKVVKALKNNPKSMGRYVWKAVEWLQRLHPINWIIMRN